MSRRKDLSIGNHLFFFFLVALWKLPLNTVTAQQHQYGTLLAFADRQHHDEEEKSGIMPPEKDATSIAPNMGSTTATKSGRAIRPKDSSPHQIPRMNGMMDSISLSQCMKRLNQLENHTFAQRLLQEAKNQASDTETRQPRTTPKETSPSVFSSKSSSNSHHHHVHAVSSLDWAVLGGGATVLWWIVFASSWSFWKKEVLRPCLSAFFLTVPAWALSGMVWLISLPNQATEHNAASESFWSWICAAWSMRNFLPQESILVYVLVEVMPVLNTLFYKMLLYHIRVQIWNSIKAQLAYQRQYWKNIVSCIQSYIRKRYYNATTTTTTTESTTMDATAKDTKTDTPWFRRAHSVLTKLVRRGRQKLFQNALDKVVKASMDAFLSAFLAALLIAPKP